MPILREETDLRLVYSAPHRKPIRCRFGFHKWVLLESHLTKYFRFRVLGCRRRGCEAQKTQVEKRLRFVE